MLDILVAAVAATALTGTPQVTDGDTFDIKGQTVRLHGIDAPESEQQCFRDEQAWPCGDDATTALKRLIGGERIRCDVRNEGRYGRSIAVCWLGDTQVNRWLVRQGWALDWPQYSDGAYQDAQAAARHAERGIWSGRFTRPWRWRRQH